MYLDEDALPGGGGPHGPFCRSCKQLIAGPATRVAFASDPDGSKGLTGDYHAACSRPFTSLASAIDAMARFGR